MAHPLFTSKTSVRGLAVLTNSKASFLKRFQLTEQKPKRNFKKKSHQGDICPPQPAGHEQSRGGSTHPLKRAIFSSSWLQNFSPRGCKTNLLVVAKSAPGRPFFIKGVFDMQQCSHSKNWYFRKQNKAITFTNGIATE